MRYDIDPQVLTSRVPVLTIQPLVENAVKHGIAAKPDGGTVRLKARVDPLTRTTTIRVSDDGVGIDPQTLAQLTSSNGATAGAETPRSVAEHAGVGLANISERLDSLFGDRYDLSISTPKAGGTRRGAHRSVAVAGARAGVYDPGHILEQCPPAP